MNLAYRRRADFRGALRVIRKQRVNLRDGRRCDLRRAFYVRCVKRVYLAYRRAVTSDADSTSFARSACDSLTSGDETSDVDCTSFASRT